MKNTMCKLYLLFFIFDLYWMDKCLHLDVQNCYDNYKKYEDTYHFDIYLSSNSAEVDIAFNFFRDRYIQLI